MMSPDRPFDELLRYLTALPPEEKQFRERMKELDQRIQKLKPGGAPQGERRIER